MPVLHAFGRYFKITVEVDGKAKEEFVDSRGQAWIAVEPGSVFQVKVDAEEDQRLKYPDCHLLQLSLDGQDVYWYTIDERSFTCTYSGYDTSELGDGSEILAFKFGEPGEEASGNRADALEITVTAKRVRETTEPIVHTAAPVPDGSKRCKKFYQPHIEAGDEIEWDDSNVPIGTNTYKQVGKEVACSIRYATVEGLAIRGVVSRTTHPHLFDDKKSRKHRAARSPLVKEESPAKKAKPEVIEIE